MDKLCLVFDSWSYKEAQTGRLFSDDRSRMLKYMLNRLSIPPANWFYTYVYAGPKKAIPTEKKARIEFLKERFDDLVKHIMWQGRSQVIAFGSLGCELFTDYTRITTRAGTVWKTSTRWQTSELALGRVWIARAVEACFFEPSLAVEIYAVIKAAAKAAGIVTTTKFADELPVFDWSDYL